MARSFRTQETLSAKTTAPPFFWGGVSRDGWEGKSKYRLNKRSLLRRSRCWNDVLRKKNIRY